MGFLRWLRRRFGGRRRYPYGRIRRTLGAWEPYGGQCCLGRTRLPQYIELPEAAAKWGGKPGNRRTNGVLLPCWLRIDPVLAGFLLKRIQAGDMYRVTNVEREGKPPRIIAEPAPVLKFVQRRILRRVLEQVRVHEAAHGFVRGRSVFSNATPHTGREVVVTMDLRDFFPSITFRRVAGLFCALGLTRENALMLGGLCCYRGSLPQGAPTSPMVSNLICWRLDSRLSGLVAKHGGHYTRYADDLTFSGDAALLSVLPLVRRIIREEGFAWAPEKFRIQRRGSRQMVTGLVVNDVVSVPRRVRRYLRAMVHRQALSGGGDEGMRRFLLGHINFMRPAHPDLASRLAERLG